MTELQQQIARQELQNLREQHRQLSIQLSDLTLEREIVNAEVSSSATRFLERETLLVKRWTIDDALSSIDYQRITVERRFCELWRLVFQADELNKHLFPGGRHCEEVQTAEDRLIEAHRRRDAALSKLLDAQRQIELLTECSKEKTLDKNPRRMRT